MHIFYAFKTLINNILFVYILKNISANNGMEVSVHKIKDQVYISIIFSPYDILQSDDVVVASEFL